MENVLVIGGGSIAKKHVKNLSKLNFCIYSYTSTSDATVFGSDVMIKHNFADGYIFSMGFSFYDNLKFN